MSRPWRLILASVVQGLAMAVVTPPGWSWQFWVLLAAWAVVVIIWATGPEATDGH